jgi:polyisoprenyl-teichoic acid--peptidoglycan teichoic acid transferase
MAVLVRDIPKENIKNAVIDNSMITIGNVILGGQKASIIRPIPDEVRVLRDEIFTSKGALSPMAEGHPITLMLEDGARLRVLNGTSTPQLETHTRNYLTEKGMSVTEIGDTKSQSRTVIVLYSPKLYTLRYLLDIFGITKSSQILIMPDSSETVDIEIRLGPDWVDKLPAE